MTDQQAADEEGLICPTCAARLDKRDNFCASCGRRLVQPGPPTDFEIGRIAALATIKKDVLTWLGSSLGLLVAVLGVMGFFGINEIIRSTVVEEVRSEVNRIRENLNKVTEDVFIDVGKAKKDQEQISKILAESAQRKDTLETSIRDLEATRQRLQDSISQLNVAAFIEKLRYDFYSIRNFSIRSEIVFKAGYKNDQNHILPRYEVFLLSKRTKQDKSESLKEMFARSFCQLGITGAPTLMTQSDDIDKSENIEKFVADLVPYEPCNDKILNRNIRILEQLDEMEILFDIVPSDLTAEMKELFLSHVDRIRIEVRVNWVNVWTLELTTENLALPEQSDHARFWAGFREVIPKDHGVVPAYEARFQENERAGPNNPQ